MKINFKSILVKFKYNKTLFKYYRKIKTFKILFQIRPSLKQYKNICVIFKVLPFSMMMPQTLKSMMDLACKTINQNIPGDFVECGVWKGGCSAAIAKVYQDLNSSKKLHLFDSFEGFPKLNKTDLIGPGKKFRAGRNKASIKDVELIFKKLNINQRNFFINKGWFNNDLFKNYEKIEKISMLHIDCDLYEGHKICLNNLYTKLSKGGFIIFNDYGYLPGVTKAVDEFFASKKINFKNNIICLKPLIYLKQ